MSKTFRRDALLLDENNHPFSTKKAEKDYIYKDRRWWERVYSFDYYSKRNKKRDTKSYFKPNRSYKTMMKKARRAKEREVLQRKDYENIPLFRKEDQRNWL